MKNYLFATALAGMVIAAPAAAQSFSYSDFSSTAGLQLNGNSATATDALNRQVLRLTPATANQSGSVFSLTQIALAANASFSTAFTFNINTNANNSFGGADGLVFVIQPLSNTTGGLGGGIGYQGIPNSLGIEFDTYDNGEPFGGNHVGVNLNGNINSVTSVASPFLLDGGTDLTAFIDYNGATQVLEVRLSDNGLRPGAALLTYSGLNLVNVLGTSSAFVGFTSGTGSGWSNHDVINWQFNNSFQPIDPNPGAVPEPATWALMLLGFGAIGAGLRRRPKVAATVSFA